MDTDVSARTVVLDKFVFNNPCGITIANFTADNLNVYKKMFVVRNLQLYYMLNKFYYVK
jgi:hypothetical protein